MWGRRYETVTYLFMLMLNIPDWVAFSSFPLVELIVDWVSVREWVGVLSIEWYDSIVV